MRTICIGECMVELRPAGPALFAQDFAGDAYNTAFYIKHSAPTMQVAFLTSTGADHWSGEMRAVWRRDGIDDGLAFTREHALPGLYVIDVDPAGERRFSYWRSASAARFWVEDLIAGGGADRLTGAELVYFSGISLAILPQTDQDRALDLLAETRRRGGRLAFDPNFRPALWPGVVRAREITARAIGLADILLPSADDLQALYGDSPPPNTAREMAITRGAEGCLLRIEGRDIDVPAPRVARVVDTSGAGDSFNGAYLASRLSGADPLSAAKAGLALAARVVAAPGAVLRTESGAF